LTRAVFTQIDADKFVLVFKSIEKKQDHDVPPFTPSTLKEREKRIRGQVTSLSVFERLPHDCCKFTYIAKADIQGSVPAVVAESGMSAFVDTVPQAYQYFERDVEIDKINRR